MTAFDQITSRLGEQAIELPSWAFGNSGTRFKVFATPGTPRTPEEKIADAAQVHKFTALAPSVALHIPWDKVDDFAALSGFAVDHGVKLGTVNSNTFQDDDYKFGSLTHIHPKIRQKAIDHHFECIDIMTEIGSRDLKIWLADGSNYPGQQDIRGRQDRLADSLAKIYGRLGQDQRLVLEYKFFEPAFYHMDVPDWGTSYVQVAALGDRAMVCLDTGHHAPGTNIEFIVAQLLRLGKLGSFDFNHSGSCANVAWPTMRAIGLAPSSLADDSRASTSTSAAAPSLIDELDAAVMVPPFLNAGLSEAILSSLTLPGPSSMAGAVGARPV